MYIVKKIQKTTYIFVKKINRRITTYIVYYTIISSREQTTAKSENEVIVRCTKDTNITPGKGKGIMRWSRNLR